MKTVRIIGLVLVVFGALVALASCLTGVFGLGTPGFGFQQIGGIVFGAVDAVLGLVLLVQKKAN